MVMYDSHLCVQDLQFGSQDSILGWLDRLWKMILWSKSFKKSHWIPNFVPSNSKDKLYFFPAYSSTAMNRLHCIEDASTSIFCARCFSSPSFKVFGVGFYVSAAKLRLMSVIYHICMFGYLCYCLLLMRNRNFHKRGAKKKIGPQLPYLMAVDG